MNQMTDAMIVIRRYVETEDGGVDEVDDFCAIEVGNDVDEVDVHISPRTDEVVTFSVSPRQAWHMARELMRAATIAEQEEGSN